MCPDSPASNQSSSSPTHPLTHARLFCVLCSTKLLGCSDWSVRLVCLRSCLCCAYLSHLQWLPCLSLPLPASFLTPPLTCILPVSLCHPSLFCFKWSFSDLSLLTLDFFFYLSASKLFLSIIQMILLFCHVLYKRDKTVFIWSHLWLHLNKSYKNIITNYYYYYI